VEITVTQCRRDALCRCRGCKPPFGAIEQRNRHEPSARIWVGSTGIAIVLILSVLLGWR
jgi:hypothetical protein